MVQLKHLEKSLEAAINEGTLKGHESTIDEYLNDHEYISSAASTRLHDALYKLFTGGLLNAKDEGSGTLTPVSTKTLDSGPSIAPEVVQAKNARVVFLEALVRLAPCIINTENLLVWWDELSVYAIDSTGHQLDIVNLSQEFIMGVITSSFYEHADPEISDLIFENSKAYGTKVLELYTSKSLPKKSVGEPTEERVRYVRQNCRIYFGHYGRKETRGAFTMLNGFFVEPKYRLDILNLVVEYLSQSQNSKLFKVYDTAFFESLLQCLEHDKTRPVLQLALTALSMCIVHVCDKLVPTRLLFRIYACFGRACSWQPETNDAANDTNDNELDVTDDDISISESGNDVLTPGRFEASSSEAATTSSSQPNSSASQSTTVEWKVLTEDPEADLNDAVEQTIDVLPLFTFLYGLFPQNTLLFSRQCDEYLANYNYQRTFSDYWSRFMVTKKVESLVRDFRIDPLLLTSNPDSELSTSVQRFQAIGSALGVTSVITSRLVSMPSDVNVNEAIDEHQRYFQALMQPLSQPTKSAEAKGSTKQDAKDLRSISLAEVGQQSSPQQSSSPSLEASPAAAPEQRESDSEGVSPEKNKLDLPERSAAYWHRELLLLRNELAFTDFRRHMSEQRALRWQKRASRWAIAELKNDELTRQNQLMESKVGSLKEESQKALRSARTIMRERSAYETKILDRNREFREQITNLETKVRELQLDAEAARHAETALSNVSHENEEKAGAAELQLRDLRNEIEATKRANTDAEEHNYVAEQTENAEMTTIEDAKWTEMKFEIENLKKERDAALDLMEREVSAAQAELARMQVTPRKHGRDPHMIEESADAVARENLAIVARLKSANEELLHRCVSVEHELRARKIHEEERMNELQAALMSARAFAPLEPPTEGRFRGRGGAQGVPRRA